MPVLRAPVEMAPAEALPKSDGSVCGCIGPPAARSAVTCGRHDGGVVDLSWTMIVANRSRFDAL
jgi:hypothetical protein